VQHKTAFQIAQSSNNKKIVIHASVENLVS